MERIFAIKKPQFIVPLSLLGFTLREINVNDSIEKGELFGIGFVYPVNVCVCVGRGCMNYINSIETHEQ